MSVAGTRAGGRASVVLSLGGNVGDKAGALRRALAALGSEPGSKLTAVSRLYRTPPWGKTDQEFFVNACAVALTSLAPETLLVRVKRLEVELGRVPAERWGPRVIDIDIIDYDDVALSTDRLTCPIPNFSTAPSCSCRWRRSRRTGRSAADASATRRRASAPRPRASFRWTDGRKTANVLLRGAFFNRKPNPMSGLVADLHLSRRRVDRRQYALHRRADARLLAGLERVRRRAGLRRRDARPRQALRPPQPFGQDHVAEADRQRGGDGRTGASRA